MSLCILSVSSLSRVLSRTHATAQLAGEEGSGVVEGLTWWLVSPGGEDRPSSPPLSCIVSSGTCHSSQFPNPPLLQTFNKR